jgi:hypothetical protein
MRHDIRPALAWAALCTVLFVNTAAAQKAATIAEKGALGSPAPVIAARNAAQLGSAVTLGLGLARREPYCGTCAGNFGFSGLVNLSRFVNRVTALGMESTVWLNDAGPVSAALGSAMGTVTLWAVESVPISVSGGMGFVVYHQGDAAYRSNTTSVGWGYSGRVGYDALVSQSLALVPYFAFMSTVEPLRVGRADQVVSNLQVGMALRFR